MQYSPAPNGEGQRAFKPAQSESLRLGTRDYKRTLADAELEGSEKDKAQKIATRGVWQHYIGR
eukprot:8563488-Karenia_brevis.AAC.1